MLKITAAPTFKAKVSIPLPGDDEKPADVVIEFRHMTKAALSAFLDEQNKNGGGYDGIAKGVVIGWAGVDEAFSQDALHRLLENYSAAGREIASTYAHELSKAKLGN